MPNFVKANFAFNDDFNAVSSEAKDFIKLLLSADKTKRPTATSALEHAWLKVCLK